MTLMLAPDLLDRRALALITLRDAFGRLVASPVQVSGDGVRTLAKGGGTVAVLEAPGFAEYSSSFAGPPAAPAVEASSIELTIAPAEPRLQARVVVIRLPRDPDPAKSDQPQSLFRPIEVPLLATPLQGRDALACVLRVRVHRKGDNALVGGALVRAKSNNGKFAAMGITDRTGEAVLVFADLPAAFAGQGGSTDRDLPAKAVVKVDAATAVFTPRSDADLASPAFSRRIDPPDPDKLSSGPAPSFAGGSAFRLSAGTEPTLEIEWEQS